VRSFFGGVDRQDEVKILQYAGSENPQAGATTTPQRNPGPNGLRKRAAADRKTPMKLNVWSRRRNEKEHEGGSVGSARKRRCKKGVKVAGPAWLPH